MIRDELLNQLRLVLKELKLPVGNIYLEYPTRSEHGDYFSNIALQLAKTDDRPFCQSPLSIAKEIKRAFESKGIGQGEVSFLEKVEVAGPGFVNFFLSQDFLLNQVKDIAAGKIVFPTFNLGDNRKVIVEFAHPNTHKLFHIGHLRNITLGESLSRTLEILGNKVIRANYQGDVGLHIAKCLWGIFRSGKDTKDLKSLPEKIAFLGQAYVKGNQAYEEDGESRQKIAQINKKIYEKDPDVGPLLQETRQWSLEYFDLIYKRLGTSFDRLYFESEVVGGEQIARRALKQGILAESEGAIIFPGEKSGLDRRVFITGAGLPTYEAKELKLAELEFSEFGRIDRCLHVVGPEQTSFFKVTFKVEELLNAQKYQGRQKHLSYGFVTLKKGKMSSREGTVVEGNWLLDEVRKKIIKSYQSDEPVAEAIAVAAVKYAMLKINRQSELVFDINESISTEGDSGPYLLYTFARASSVLAKAGGLSETNFESYNPGREELAVVRLLPRFPEVVEQAGKNFAPNLICNYLFDLAQSFNLFYGKNPILEPEGEKIAPMRALRLGLTAATAQVIKTGLGLLGIRALERM